MKDKVSQNKGEQGTKTEKEGENRSNEGEIYKFRGTLALELFSISTIQYLLLPTCAPIFDIPSEININVM